VPSGRVAYGAGGAEVRDDCEEDVVRAMKDRLTYANVTATVALFIALGGTSYAAVTLPRNSVGATQIRAGSVGSSEVRDRSLTVRDFNPRSGRALRGARGPAGPAGPAGGTAGAADAADLTYKTVSGTVARAPRDETTTATATARCDSGQRVTGGGVRVEDVNVLSVHDSFPVPDGTGWTANVGNDDDVGHSFTVYAVCIP
jgi:hypothetical protein